MAHLHLAGAGVLVGEVAVVIRHDLAAELVEVDLTAAVRIEEIDTERQGLGGEGAAGLNAALLGREPTRAENREEGGGVSDRRGRWGFGHLRGEVEVVGSEEVSELDAVDGAGAIPDGHTNPR